MDCKEFRELLDLHLDRELSADAEAEARLHAKECARCHAVEQQLKRLRQSLKTLVAKNEPPQRLMREVAAIGQPWWLRTFRLRDRKAAELWSSRVALPAPIFAVLLVVVCAALLVLVQQIASKAFDITSAGKNTVQVEIPAGEPANSLMDLTRFDQGGRITLKHAPR